MLSDDSRNTDTKCNQSASDVRTYFTPQGCESSNLNCIFEGANSNTISRKSPVGGLPPVTCLLQRNFQVAPSSFCPYLSGLSPAPFAASSARRLASQLLDYSASLPQSTAWAGALIPRGARSPLWCSKPTVYGHPFVLCPKASLTEFRTCRMIRTSISYI